MTVFLLAAAVALAAVLAHALALAAPAPPCLAPGEELTGIAIAVPGSVDICLHHMLPDQPYELRISYRAPDNLALSVLWPASSAGESVGSRRLLNTHLTRLVGAPASAPTLARISAMREAVSIAASDSAAVQQPAHINVALDPLVLFGLLPARALDMLALAGLLVLSVLAVLALLASSTSLMQGTKPRILTD